MAFFNLPPWVGPFLALARHYISDEVIDVIKQKAQEAWEKTSSEGWGDGERTAFVIQAAQEITAATPTKIDDILVKVAALLYLKKYGPK
jgi:hypothetical protein